jgi:Flp pilus assembly protein TadG
LVLDGRPVAKAALPERRPRSQRGQSTTETLLMMMFLMLLIFGFIHLSMLATTKYLVNFAAFSAGRTAMIGQPARLGTASALLYLRWDQFPRTTDNTSKTIRGKTRSGITVTYDVPFAAFFNKTSLTGFSPYTKQPNIPEEGDNAGS